MISRSVCDQETFIFVFLFEVKGVTSVTVNATNVHGMVRLLKYIFSHFISMNNFVAFD